MIGRRESVKWDYKEWIAQYEIGKTRAPGRITMKLKSKGERKNGEFNAG